MASEAHSPQVTASTSSPTPPRCPTRPRACLFRGGHGHRRPQRDLPRLGQPQGGLVGCKFQYSTDEINWTDVSVPNCAALSENGGAQNISRKVSGLVPGQKYFVRLQVTRPYFSSFTPVTTSFTSFTTATGAPVLADVSAKAVDERSVRVSATIDPSNSPTSYVVQYGTTPTLGSSTAPVQIGARNLAG